MARDGKRFSVLHLLANGFEILAALNGLGSFITLLYALDAGYWILTGIGILVAIFMVLVCLAIAQLLRVILAIEENTRKAVG